MRGILAFSVVAPLALAMAACAAGGESTNAGDEIERDGGLGGSDGGNGTDAGAGGGQADGGDIDPDASTDGGDDDPGDAGDDPDGDSGTGDAGDGDGGDDVDSGDGGEDPGDPDAGDAEPDPCAPTECFIGDACVEGGLPNPTNSCEVCLPTINKRAYTHDANSPACDGKPYWDGVTHAFPVTPYGRKTAVSCHNCYTLGSSNTDSLTKTLANVHDAQAKGADLIELDIKEQGGVVYVEHDDSGGTRGALFADVALDDALKAGSQILFIESKETTTSEPYMRTVLETLKANGYAKAGRPVVLRAFDNVSANLAVARKLLALPDFVSMRPHVRLHVLFSRGDGNNIAALQTRIKGVKDKGFHGVEFEYQTANLFSALKYAESLDLGINVWTIPVSVGEVFLATLRDEVDAITVDYPVDKSRAVIEHQNGLLYMNAFGQSAAGNSVKWFARDGSVSSDLSLTPQGRPSLVTDGPGQSLFGTSLRFFGAQAAPLYDADNDPNDGYLVSAVVTFDNPIPADNETSVLVGKAEYAGFSLELHNPSGGGNADAVLRFGVRVDGKYYYATYNANSLQVGPSYLITGAYDGDGDVWLWINNNAASVTKVKPPKMGVTQNDVPVIIGADPQEVGDPRFFFNGKVQMALVQKWANH